MAIIDSVKAKISTLHALMNDLSGNSTSRQYHLYGLFVLDSLATLLNYGVLYGIFYLYLQERIDLLLCILALLSSVAIKLLLSYLKIHREAAILEQLSLVISQVAFTHLLNKQDDHQTKTTFRIEQLSHRVSRCLASYFELFANFILFLITFLLILFKPTVILTLLGYVVMIFFLLRFLNKKKQKTEWLYEKYQLSRRYFTEDVLQLKETLKGMAHESYVPSKFASVDRKHFRLKRWLESFGLTRKAAVEVFTIFYLIACFLLWTALYDKEQVLLLVSMMVLLTAQLFPKAIRVVVCYHEMSNHFPFVKKYLDLKTEKMITAYQGEGQLEFDGEALVINQLTLCYDQRLLFEQACLKVSAPGHYILKAPNGSGKSTLLKWLLEEMKGMEIKVYYIPQQLHVFNGSILENIKLFSPRYKEESVWLALKASGFFAVMEEKNYTLSSLISVKELSGGEKAKLILASMIYHQADFSVLLIDEVTANLDKKAKIHFYHTLANRLKDKLIIEITHETAYCQQPHYIHIKNRQLYLTEGGSQSK